MFNSEMSLLKLTCALVTSLTTLLSLYRQQKMAEREKRSMEQQRKKMEKEAQRMMKKEQKIAVKLS